MNTSDSDQRLKSILLRVHDQVSKHFVERREQQESWTMPPSDYDGSQLIFDDCDGFCLAVRRLLRRSGIRNRLVYCEIEGMGHLVVEVDGWILDNRQGTVVPNSLLQHYKWLRISGYEPGESWREIVGF